MLSTDVLSIQLHQLAYLKLLKLLKRYKLNIDKFRLPKERITTRLVGPKVKSLLERILGKEKFYISKQRGLFTWYVNANEEINDYSYEFEEYVDEHPKVKEIEQRYGHKYSWCNVNVFDYNNVNIEFNHSVIKEVLKYKNYVEELNELKKQLYNEWSKKEEKKKEILKKTIQKKYDVIAKKTERR